MVNLNADVETHKRKLAALSIEESGLRNDIMIQLPVDLQPVHVSNTARFH